MIDETHDPARRSWVESAQHPGDFPIQNLPLGVFSPGGGHARVGVAIGDMILDVAAAANVGLFGAVDDRLAAALGQPTLNALLALPCEARLDLRRRLSDLLDARRSEVPPTAELLHAAEACTMHLPARIGDFTDFYAGIHHAENVGRLFRPDQPLLPNYKHVPIGYHGRASSVMPSGAKVTRPLGQTKPSDRGMPCFGPTRRLDFEMELGIWIGEGNVLGTPIDIAVAERQVAGLCLLNDWSARDIQAWEYQPLGPFLAKSFATTVSPWVITSEALAPFRIAPASRPQSDPVPLAYLRDPVDEAMGGYAIDLEVALLSAGMQERGEAATLLGRSAQRHMYWTIAQLVAHHSVGGCNLQPGDLLGSGTISAPEPGGQGSLLEITSGGRDPVSLPDGESRTFLEDGDAIMLRGRAQAPGLVSIGFGPCTGVISPAAQR
jgi:fumarylacetoacetase